MMITARKAYEVAQSHIDERNKRVQKEAEAYADGELTDLIEKVANIGETDIRITVPENINTCALCKYLEENGYKTKHVQDRDYAIEWNCAELAFQ